MKYLWLIHSIDPKKFFCPIQERAHSLYCVENGEYCRTYRWEKNFFFEKDCQMSMSFVPFSIVCVCKHKKAVHFCSENSGVKKCTSYVQTHLEQWLRNVTHLSLSRGGLSSESLPFLRLYQEILNQAHAHLSPKRRSQ